MNLSRLFVVLSILFLALPAYGQGLVFQGNNSFIDREQNKDASDGIGAGLRELQERNPEIIVDRIIRLTRSTDGHFYADLTVNGVNINFLIDTGSSNIALSNQDARRIGIEMFRLDYSHLAKTANGEIEIAPTTLRSIVLGETKNYDFPAYVFGEQASISLLGMTYLSQFSQIEIIDNFMILHP